MKKILIISPEIPYPVYKGNQNRIDNIIRMLLNEGHELALAVLNSSQAASSQSIRNNLFKRYPGIKYIEVRKHPKLRRDFRFFIHKVRTFFDSPDNISNENTCPKKFVTCVKYITSTFKPDIIILNYIKLAKAMPSNFSGKKIVDIHDFQTNIIRAARKNFDEKKFYESELSALKKFDTIISINENETDQILSLDGTLNIVTIPAFTDYKEFRSSKQAYYDLMFIGSASPFNIEGLRMFIKYSFPIINKKYPNLKFAIAGDVSTCASIKSDASRYNNINLLGRIDNLDNIYYNSKIVISPIIRGAGMKVKNIEAMSYGKAIVATPFSMDGIKVEHHINSLLATRWDIFAKHIDHLLSNEELIDNIGKSAHLLFLKRYSIASAKKIFHNIFYPEDRNIFENEYTDGHFLIENENITFQKRRTKALLFSTDSRSLIDFNIYLANIFRELGIYSEIVKVKRTGCGHILKSRYIPHVLIDKITPARRESLRKTIHFEIKDNKFSNITYNGIHLEDDFNVYLRMFPQHFEKSFRDVVVHSFLLLDELIKVIKKINPDFIVGWNGHGPNMIFLMKIAAKITKKKIFHIERGLLANTLAFDRRGVNFESCLSGSYLPLLTNKERSKIKNFINIFNQKGKTIVQDNQVSNISFNDIDKKLNLNGRPYIFFPAQIETDSNIIVNSYFYTKMNEVLKDICQIADEFGLNVICRPHPEDKNKRTFISAHNLIIDSSFHLHAMLKHSLANIVINSTVGLESILLKKPTIALGSSIYSSKGITFDANCKEQIRVHIKNIVNNNYDHKIIERRTESLLYYILKNYTIPLDSKVAAIDVMQRYLSNNGIIITYSDPIKNPQMVEKYNRRRLIYEKTIKACNNIYITNMLTPDTIQKYNSTKEIVITSSLIVDHFQRISKAKIHIGNWRDLEKRDGDVIIYIVNGNHKNKFDKYADFVIDEYFDLHPWIQGSNN